MNEIEDKELLDSMSDEECFITMMKQLNTPIMRRHLSDDLNYCIMRVLKNEKVRELMDNYDKSIEIKNNLFVWVPLKFFGLLDVLCRLFAGFSHHFILNRRILQ